MIAAEAMAKPGPTEPLHIDPLLEPLLAAHDAAARDEALGTLLTQHADPVIRRGLRHRFGATQSAEIEDIRSSVIVRLLNRLERVDDPEADHIASFADYVAMVTYNTIDDYARRRNPQRTLLANRVRYVLTHDDRFALWRRDRDLICGYAAWNGQRAGTQAFETHDADERSLGDSLDRAFRRAAAPADFHDVVQAFATSAGLNESTMPVTEIDLVDATPSAYDQLASREAADALWGEIQQLPVRQRVALLLGARDAAGQSAVSMFPGSGVATIQEIAAVVEIALDELVSLWNDLPLDDNTIAARLGASRQQIINLRKSARDRLARRLRRR
jgi:RNA polymerase sigma factor (sigma-70 family)